MKINVEDIKAIKDIKVMSRLGFDNDYIKTEQNDGIITCYIKDGVSIFYNNILMTNIMGIQFTDDVTTIKFNDHTENLVYSKDGFFVLSLESEEDKENDVPAIVKMEFVEYPSFLNTDNLDTDDFPIFELGVKPYIHPATGRVCYIGNINIYFRYMSLLPYKFMVTKLHDSELQCNIDLLSIQNNISYIKDRLKDLLASQNPIISIQDEKETNVYRVSSFVDFCIICKDTDGNEAKIPYETLIKFKDAWGVTSGTYIDITSEENGDYVMRGNDYFESTYSSEYKEKLMKKCVDIIESTPEMEDINTINIAFSQNNFDIINNFGGLEYIKAMSERIDTILLKYKELASEYDKIFNGILVLNKNFNKLYRIDLDFYSFHESNSQLFKEYVSYLEEISNSEEEEDVISEDEDTEE